MKQRFGLLSFLLLLALIYYSFYSLMPQDGKPANAPDTEFSAHRALVQLQEIAQKPHYHANDEHTRVRNYLVEELKELGFEVQLQADPLLELSRYPKKEGDDVVLVAGNYKLITPVNIIARMKGVGNSKALLLLSHYDSAKVPSPGASDAGSGIVTILEAVRAYLASGAEPENDLIILFTDAEELGLDGAKTFVRQHPWAKDVGLALNFEARGSGGPSNMIVETNGGNAGLIDAFAQASPSFPVASSLMYSVYKMLPNDTDSTILRKDGDIDSFFFAFIDDHFDYHTASDTIENLDVETLQHQGSYLLPLLHYFLQADLANLKSETDQVYVNVPQLFIHYPFAWVIPMVLIAAALLILLINYGFYIQQLDWKGIGRGMAALAVALVVCGLLGYFGWQFIEQSYPQYSEIQHGFKYNGHSYIAFFVLISLGITLYSYRKIAAGQRVSSLLIAPVFIWILINAAVAVYLKGAGYFVIPVYFALITLWVLLRQQRPNMLLLLLLGAPAIFIYSPLVQFFPVGLGSNMVVISCVFVVLMFGLLYGLLGFFSQKRVLTWACIALGLFYFFKAHSQSDFNEVRKKPNSLVYYLDKDNDKAYWATYDHMTDKWTRSYLGENPLSASEVMPAATISKYNRPYTYAAKAPLKNLLPSELIINKDSASGGERLLDVSIVPQRRIDQLYLYRTENLHFSELFFNGIATEKENDSVLINQFSPLLLTVNCKKGDTLNVRFTTPQQDEITLKTITYSFDLMENPLMEIKARGPAMMTKPFVNSDATIVKNSHTLPAYSDVVEMPATPLNSGSNE